MLSPDTSSTLIEPGVFMSDSAPTENSVVKRTAGGAQRKQDDGSDRIYLRVLGKFDVAVNGRSVSLGVMSQRLLTLLAIRSSQVPSGHMLRGHAAGRLWPETRTSRAAANLRSAIWRLQQTCPGVLEASFSDLRLAAGVSVDIAEVTSVAFGLLVPTADPSAAQLSDAVRCNLYDDIDPDIGEDDWLTAERERFHQLRIHALEALADKLIAAGSHGAAVEAALGAIRADPFRERAHHLLISAYLAEGSQLEARRQYTAYCELLRRELDLAPSAEFTALFGNAMPHVGPGAASAGMPLSGPASHPDQHSDRRPGTSPGYDVPSQGRRGQSQLPSALIGGRRVVGLD
jgi:DNA-binding SARP family transcriptional activator